MSGLATLGGRRSLLPPRANRDPHEITDTKAGYLAEMIRRPVAYTQRFVEQISFVPTGGLRWRRDLQIRLPAADKPGARWWILPLGPFDRRRLPDITAVNAAGEPLNLLTRKAHGQALAKATIQRLFAELSPATRQVLERPPAAAGVSKLKDLIAAWFIEPTERPVAADISALSENPAAPRANLHPRIVNARAILRDFKALLKSTGAGEGERTASWDALCAVLTEAVDTTQYLCWVEDEPGAVINVCVSHTNSDPQHSLKRRTIKSFLWAMLYGFLTTRKKHRREEAADWFRRFGLAPINYEFNVPTFLYTASYYSTIAPPEKTDLTYLDWEVGNSYEERENEYSEVSSSLPSVHVYNGDPGQGKAKAKTKPKSIRAYVRCKPHHHKQIIGAALLNIVFVWLLGDGRLPGRPGDPLQGLVIAAPSVLIAFLAQQQRHYYEHMLRPSRGILWVYLAINGFFLVAVAFSGQELSEGGPGLGTIARVAAGLLAVSSVAIVIWHFPLAHLYESLVGKLYRRKLRKGKTSWQAYESAYECLSQWIWRLVVISAVIATVLVVRVWDPPDSGSKDGPNPNRSGGTTFVEQAPDR